MKKIIVLCLFGLIFGSMIAKDEVQSSLSLNEQLRRESASRMLSIQGRPFTLTLSSENLAGIRSESALLRLLTSPDVGPIRISLDFNNRARNDFLREPGEQNSRVLRNYFWLR